MTDSPRYVTLRDYLRVLRAHRLLIVLTALLFGAAGFALAAREDPIYASQSAVSFSESQADADLLGSRQSGPQGADVRPFVNAQLVDDAATAKRVKDELETDLSVPELQKAVTGTVEGQTALLLIEARANDPSFAAELAQAFAQRVVATATKDERERFAEAADSLRDESKKLESSKEPDSVAGALTEDRLARLQTLSDFARPAAVVQDAEISESPISPKPIRNTLLGLAVGLTLGILGAFLRDALDRRLHGSHQIQEQLNLPLLGQVADDALGRTAFSSNGREAMSQPQIEAFRILRTSLELSNREDPPRLIAVTSGLPQEGKSTVAGALAGVSANTGKRTALVECDLRRPSLADRTGLHPRPGLTDYLAHQATLEEVRQPLPVERSPVRVAATNASTTGIEEDLVCITAGAPVPNPAELLGSPRFRDLLFDLSESFEAIVLDTSPLLAVADTREFLPFVDSVLLCVRASKTTREEAAAVKRALNTAPATPVALVVTGVTAREETDYGYYSYAHVGET